MAVAASGSTVRLSAPARAHGGAIPPLAVARPFPEKVRSIIGTEPDEADDPECGSAAVLAVTGVGMLALMAMLSLAGRSVVEHRAVEDSIAEMRAYWAAVGQATYVMSRIRADTASGDIAGAVQGYMVEIGDGSKGKNTPATWYYPDVSTSYAFAVSPAIPSGQDGSQNGIMVLSYAFSAPDAGGMPEALRTIPRTRTVDVGFCVSASQSSCAAQPQQGARAYNRITSIHRTAQ